MHLFQIRVATAKLHGFNLRDVRISVFWVLSKPRNTIYFSVLGAPCNLCILISLNTISLIGSLFFLHFHRYLHRSVLLQARNLNKRGCMAAGMGDHALLSIKIKIASDESGLQIDTEEYSEDLIATCLKPPRLNLEQGRI